MSGGVRRERQFLDRASLQRLAAATGHDDPVHAWPALAHWAWFPDLVPAGQIGTDGHPRPGALLPATGRPRRMFASAAIEFAAPLILAAPAEFEERIVDQRERSGKSGALVLMDIERRIIQEGTVRIAERRTIVYRDAGGVTPPVVCSADADVDGSWLPDPVELFRFSAATFNAHRIHYDRDYARDGEGYPDLVVHGPLTACKLADLAAREGDLASFAFRAEVPLFVGQPILLRRSDDTTFLAVRCDGATAMTATVSWK